MWIRTHKKGMCGADYDQLCPHTGRCRDLTDDRKLHQKQQIQSVPEVLPDRAGALRQGHICGLSGKQVYVQSCEGVHRSVEKDLDLTLKGLGSYGSIGRRDRLKVRF